MYEMVIGVEVHFELSTRTKLFCRCQNRFGAPKNTLCCPVCAGLPGALPVLNKRAVEYALMAGLALGCKANSSTRFDRKSYFYPDMPNGYQTTQMFVPICTDGLLEFDLNGQKRSVGIREIHLEDDAGGLIHGDGCTKIDFNRAGVPLIEVVTRPDLHSAEETVAFLEELRLLMGYLGVSDCKMQEGSMRVDVNLSVHEPSQPLGTRTEMKNLNSFRAVSHAIDHEARRQIDLIRSGLTVEQETCRFDDVRGISSPLRNKEDAVDYRFFPEPNLPDVVIDEEWIDSLRCGLPEFAPSRKRRYIADLGIGPNDAHTITADKFVADFFESAAALTDNPIEVANRIVGDVMREQNEQKIPLNRSCLTPEKLAKVISLCDGRRINRSVSRQVIAAAYADNIDIEEYIRQHGLYQIDDRAVIRDHASDIIASNQKAVSDWLGGKSQVFGNIVGQTMKRLDGRGDPAAVNEIVLELLENEKNS